MFIEQLLQTLPLAASDEAGFVSALLAQLVLWGRVALGIGLVIFVHELGHFVAAKTFGVKCEKFYVGFDVPIKIGPIKFPRTLGKFTYGETEYGIGIIPLGGYVKMLGQDDDPRKAEEEAKRIQLARENDEFGDDSVEPQLDPRSYPAKPVWQRMIIISAGVIMNVITGVIFAAIAFGYGVSYNPAIIGGVSPGGPAWKAGIEPGGKVVSVGGLEDDQMHFREMRIAILSEGLEHPEKPIDIAIQYDDGIRKYKLETASRPDNPDIRMIGITSPTSLRLAKDRFALPGSVAESVLSDSEAGAKIVAYDGNPINFNSIVPSTQFFNYLYSNPDKTISLSLERPDGSLEKVDLPPQPNKTIGIRWAIGPIIDVIEDGPASQAGIKSGDKIISVNGESSLDAYNLPVDMALTKEPVKLTLQRVEGDESKTVELEVKPQPKLQTLPPTSGMAGEIAVSSLGFSYQALPVVADVLPKLIVTEPTSEDTELRSGDKIQEIRLVASTSELPDEFKDGIYAELVTELREGWEESGGLPLGALLDSIQFLPEGAELKVLATRGEQNRVIEARMAVQLDDRMRFERGLGLTASESVQTAKSFSEALVLGIREGKRRMSDVFRFLRMLPKGQVKLRHVGGPLEIVNIAKHEAERGISPQLLFLTMLSMNLAILNFLPIPALDGGHMVFLIAEAIRGKRLDEQLEMKLTMAGVLTILLLMVVVFANDILRHL